MVLSGWALWRGRRNPRSHPTFSLASSGLFMLGLATISLGMLALFLDLEHKLYVWRLYLTMKPWSPMSWGSWILLLVYPVLAAARAPRAAGAARPARCPAIGPARRSAWPTTCACDARSASSRWRPGSGSASTRASCSRPSARGRSGRAASSGRSSWPPASPRAPPSPTGPRPSRRSGGRWPGSTTCSW